MYDESTFSNSTNFNTQTEARRTQMQQQQQQQHSTKTQTNATENPTAKAVRKPKPKPKPKSLVGSKNSTASIGAQTQNDEPVKLTKFQPYDSLSRNDIALAASKQAQNGSSTIERSQSSASIQIGKSVSSDQLASSINNNNNIINPREQPKAMQQINGSPQQQVNTLNPNLNQNQNPNLNLNLNPNVEAREPKWPAGWFSQKPAKPQQQQLQQQQQLVQLAVINSQNGNNSQTPLSNSQSTPDLARPTIDKPEPQPAQSRAFQLVWSQLAFEPKLSAYERMLSCSLIRHFRRLLRLRAAERTISSAGSDVVEPSDNRQQQRQQQQQQPWSSSQRRACIKPTGAPSSRRKSRLIFENLNGHINSHELTAILGPSGSGKTSLLNAICGRTDDYRGLIELRGFEATKSNQNHNSNSNSNSNSNIKLRRLRLSIIPQKDYLIENLTVWENLIYSSKILNCDKEFKHEPNIMRVVKMLKLDNCLDSSVSKISGGEYKRVSIAQELLRQPDILVLDEPTSGLDSMNCKNLVMSLLQLTEASRRAAIKPIAIVLSIHQPDVEIFHLFDHVYCMAKRGRVIFDGRPADVLGLLGELVPDLIATSGGRNNVAAAAATDANQDSLVEAEATCAQTPMLPVTVNPANLLIEIASEDIYGPEYVDKLAKYQLEQFERAYYEPIDCVGSHQVDMMLATPKQNHSNPNPNPNPNSNSNPIAVKLNQTQLSHNNSTKLLANSKSQPKSKSLISFQQLPINAHAQTNRTGTVFARSALTSILAHKADTQLVRDKQLDTSKNSDNVGKFWYHTGLLTRRAFKSTIRDPLMTLISLIFHLSIPFVMWTVYSRDTGSVRACPIIQREMELLALTQNSTMELVSKQQDQLITAIECSTMFFLSTYSFSMCSLSIAALAFPLNMHVLLKETRNGWYSLPAFVVAKTLASFLFEVIFPVASLVMIYLMLGMPSSIYQWRLLAIAAVMALISMLSHTQGLIFGALCMDSVQTAIFLASALTLPQTVLSGFTARIKHMPYLLQKLSWLSLYRYSSDSINVIRFGFGICECNQATDEYLKNTKPTFVDAPQSVQNLLNFYLTSNRDNLTQDHEHSSIAGVGNELIMNATTRNQTIERLESRQVNLFDHMAELTTRSFSYGKPIEDCSSVKSQLLTTVGAPDDQYLPYLFGGMIGLLVVTRVILFLVVKYKLANRI